MLREQRLIREVNERIAEIGGTLGDGSDIFDFLCECADEDCIEAVSLTLKEYAQTSRVGWVLVKGHSAEQEDVA